MGMSPEFLKALLKLKADIGPVLKNAESQHTKRKYADIAAVHKAIDGPLEKNGFLLFHEFETVGEQVLMHTHLLNEHGALKSTLPLSVQNLSGMNFYQAMGSAITYQRRYAVMALLGMPAEDDDGKAAGQPAKGKGAPADATEAPAATEQSETARLASAVPKYLERIAAAQSLDEIETLQSKNGKLLKAAKERPALKKQIEEATMKRIDQVASFSEKADREVGELPDVARPLAAG